MHTILDVTHAQEARAVARAWLAKFGDAAAEANPGQLLQFVLLLAAAGQREAEGWLTKVNQAHPSPAPGLDALAHGAWAAYYLNRGSIGLALEHNRLARQAVSAAAGQGPLFPMLARAAPAGSRSALAGRRPPGGGRRPPAAAPAPLSAPIVDEFRSPVTQAWVAFLQGDLVSAGAALDRVAGAAAEHDAVAHGVGRILANLAASGDPPGAARTRARRGPAGRGPGGGTDQRPPVSSRPWSTPGSPGWPRLRGTGRARWRPWPRHAWPSPRPTTGSGPSSRSRSSASRSPWRQPKRAR